jgi:isoquinoline 1-oxidoreductase
MFGPALRAAAAQARTTLLELAAEKLRVPTTRLAIHDGIISVVGNSARQLSYGELSQGARITRVVDRKAALKAAADFHLLDTSPHRLDALEKITGRAHYATDIRLPRMLYARILRPTTHSATRTSLDTSGAKAIPESHWWRETNWSPCCTRIQK